VKRFSANDLKEIREEAYERQRERAPASKRTAPKIGVPTLPESNKMPPPEFQAKLDEFNRSTGERLFLYYNRRAIPQVSNLVNIEGVRTVREWEPRWEIWRPLNERMPRSVFDRVHPVIIAGHGPAVKIWTCLGEPISHIRLVMNNRERVFAIGKFREPDDRDIRMLRLGDLYRADPERVIKELVDDPNEKLTADAERELDDLIRGITDYMYSLPNPIVSMNPETNVGGKADWRSAKGMRR